MAELLSEYVQDLIERVEQDGATVELNQVNLAGALSYLKILAEKVEVMEEVQQTLIDSGKSNSGSIRDLINAIQKFQGED
jgi:hypothetical protein